MTIETATKYYIANKPVHHKTLGLLLIVDLYPSRQREGKAKQRRRDGLPARVSRPRLVPHC